jgi:hypothetical protein
MVKGITEHRRAFDQLALDGFEPAMGALASRPLPISPHGGPAGAPATPAPKLPNLKSPVGRRYCKPLHNSPAKPDIPIDDLIHGAKLLGFVPSAQQERFGRIMNAVKADGLPRHRRTAKTMPRRSGKTDGLLALAVGRCTTRPDYYVAFSAQSGKKGRDRFLKMAVKLERYDPCLRPSRTRPDGCTRTDNDHVHYRIYRSNGGERIEWVNGSVFMVLPPDAEVYRGEEYHLIILDEAQETEDDDAADELLGGINPTMDTVPEAQLVVAGTAGKRRSGLLWRSLEKGRAGVWGILEYAAPLEADPTSEAVWLAAHPGIGTLTTLEVIRENFDDMTLVEFQREYLGQWPADAAVSAIDAEQWKRAGADALPVRPRRVGVAFDVAPDGSAAAIACAWRDEDGRAHVEVLAYRSSVAWLPLEAHRIGRESRSPIAYDVIGQNTNPAESITRRNPPVRLAPMNMKDSQGAAQRIVSELAAGNLVHYRQKDLDAAVDGANWRNVAGDSARLFGHKASAHGITPLTAAAMALWHYDKTTRRARTARARPTIPTTERPAA